MKVLFVTDKYYPFPYANAICVQNVAREMVDEGIETHILAFEDCGMEMPLEKDGAIVHKVKMDLGLKLLYFANNFPNSIWNKPLALLGHFISKAKKAVFYNKYPLGSVTFPMRIYKKIKRLNKELNFDVVVSAFGPFEGELAGYWFKKKHQQTKWIIYNIDGFSDGGANKLVNEEVRQKAAYFWETKFYNMADKIINMVCHEEYYKAEKYQKWQYKMVTADIPFMQFPKSDNKFEKSEYLDDKAENWVYAGVLKKHIYSPEMLIKVFFALPDDKNIRVLNFFSRGEYEKELDKLQKESNGKIMRKGYIEHEKLMSVLECSTVNVSVGIKNGNQVSAKVFEYISYGKPLIHFSGSSTDPNITTVEKYPLGLVIRDYEESVESAANKVKIFIENKKNNSVSQEALKSIYKLNTPEYTANIIKGVILDGK
ncbi:MAG: hypothetical protein RR424_04035 [Oscillospiraceae bacterium]